MPCNWIAIQTTMDRNATTSGDSDGDELFLTQSKFSQIDDVGINSEFEDLLNDRFPVEFTGCNFEMRPDSEEELLCNASQEIEKVYQMNPQVEFTECNFGMRPDSEEELLCDASQEIETANERQKPIEQKVPRQIASSTETASTIKPQNNPGTVRGNFRFGAPLSDTDVVKLCESSRSVNTVKKSSWVVRLYQSWVRERHIRSNDVSSWLKESILDQAADEDHLNRALMLFVAEVKNQKGENYRGNTLYEIIASLQYHLKLNGVVVSLFDSTKYIGMRSVLDARMKDMARQGVGIEKRQAEIITEAEKDILWNTNILGEDNPQQLLDTVLYLCGLNFALCAGDEHRYLRVGPNSQLKLLVDSNGFKQLQYTEDSSKSNKGGIKERKLERKRVTVSQNLEQPERCFIRLYEKFISLRLTGGQCSALYLRPLKNPKEHVWYADSPIGIHPLRSTVERLCQKAGFKGFYSNHSLRATAATRLFNAGVDSQLISEKTGHRSSAVQNYNRTTSELKERVDDIVQRKRCCKSLASAPSNEPCGLPIGLSGASETASEKPTAQLDMSSSSDRQLKLVLHDGAEFSIKF